MRPEHKRIRTLHRCVAGATAVEFAMIAMIMILLCVGMIDFGRGLYVYNEIAYAADKGARVILLKNDIATENVENAIRDAFRAGNRDLLGITSTVGSDYRTVEISYPLTLLIPNLSPINLRLNRQIPLTNPLN